MIRSVQEINEKIRKGKAVVVSAAEFPSIAKKEGIREASRKIDVVTTGTFGPMCSSGVFLNFGQSKPKIRMQRVLINGVEAYTGLAAVDAYIGASQERNDDIRRGLSPSRLSYGGGHVIEDLLKGERLTLEAFSSGTDCYPRKKWTKNFTLKELGDAIMVNPRNAYQNYNCAVNTSQKTIYTYMGMLKPDMGNINYCSAGELSPLLNDPEYRAIGIGTRIFLGGGLGYVSFRGTQHSPKVKRNKFGTPVEPAGTLMVTGDLKGMSSKWIKGLNFTGYGVSLMVGIGIPIPIINEKVAAACAQGPEDITAPIVDYSKDYPEATGKIISRASYADLRSGSVKIEGKDIPTASLSSYFKALEIAEILKDKIDKKDFYLGEAQELLSRS